MLSSAPALVGPRSAPAAAEARAEPRDAGCAARAQAWPVAILGVPFDPVTLAGAVDRIEAMIDGGGSHYVVTPNVDFLVQVRRDPELHRILVQADLILCDGKPLVWASRWLGNALPGRVAGSDLVPELLARAAARNWKIFLLGGAPGVGAEAARRIAAAYPSLPTVGYDSPPQLPLAEMNHAEIIARVRAATPDLVLVCFGCPKQEKWIFQHYRTLGAPVLIGAGGTVDFLAGRLKRAPRWIRRLGIESFFRLAQEPRRLFKRYAGDLVRFLPAFGAQLWHLPAGKKRDEGLPLKAPSFVPMPYGIKVLAAGRLHRDALQRTPIFWADAAGQPGHCLIDLAEVQSIDSTGLAFLAHWQRRLAQAQRNLILFRPSAPVRNALSRMRLTDQFVITAGPSVALRTKPGPAARSGRIVAGGGL